jgi:hypothetical protein
LALDAHAVVAVPHLPAEDTPRPFSCVAASSYRVTAGSGQRPSNVAQVSGVTGRKGTMKDEIRRCPCLEAHLPVR